MKGFKLQTNSVLFQLATSSRPEIEEGLLWLFFRWRWSRPGKSEGISHPNTWTLASPRANLLSQGPTWVQQAIGNDMHLCSSKSMGLHTHVATSQGCFQRLLGRRGKKHHWFTHLSHIMQLALRCVCSSQRCKDDPSWQATVSNAALLSKLKCGSSCCKWLFGESTPHIPERRSRCNDAIPAHSVAYPIRLLMAVNGSGACVQGCNPTFCSETWDACSSLWPQRDDRHYIKTHNEEFFFRSPL